MAARPIPEGPFRATVVGSMPKPSWLLGASKPAGPGARGQGNEVVWRFQGEALKAAQDDAVRVTLHDQASAGLDVLSDGEQRRRYYVTYVTERLEGFDYSRLVGKQVRKGVLIHDVGRCIGPIRRTRPILEADVRFLLAETDRPVKITLPGPMTVVDSTADEHYGDERAMAFAVADALNAEARALDALGVSVIQFDEPVFSRHPDRVAAWGIAALDRACEGIVNARTAVHVCYGYPNPGVKRAFVDSYPTILAALETSRVDQLALEFEASGLDPRLLRLCPSKTVMFGCIDNGHEGNLAVESPEHVCRRLLAAAEHMPAEQIMAAPDCGLVKLPLAVARAKLASMAKGAALAREAYRG